LAGFLAKSDGRVDLGLCDGHEGCKPTLDFFQPTYSFPDGECAMQQLQKLPSCVSAEAGALLIDDARPLADKLQNLLNVGESKKILSSDDIQARKWCWGIACAAARAILVLRGEKALEGQIFQGENAERLKAISDLLINAAQAKVMMEMSDSATALDGIMKPWLGEGKLHSLLLTAVVSGFAKAITRLYTGLRAEPHLHTVDVLVQGKDEMDRIARGMSSIRRVFENLLCLHLLTDAQAACG
jgi:hypothetical protein